MRCTKHLRMWCLQIQQQQQQQQQAPLWHSLQQHQEQQHQAATQALTPHLACQVKRCCCRALLLVQRSSMQQEVAAAGPTLWQNLLLLLRWTAGCRSQSNLCISNKYWTWMLQHTQQLLA
jgi:hypothetical protein